MRGEIVGVVGVGQDITALKRKEEELSNFASDLQTLINTANAPIFGIAPDGLVNEWNNKAAEITGFSKDFVMGRDLVENFITDDYREAVRQVLDDALAGTPTDNFEFPLMTHSEDRIEVLLNATARRDVRGEIVGVVGVGQDITALKVKEKEVT